MYTAVPDLRDLLLSFASLTPTDVEQRLKQMYVQMAGVPFVHPDALEATLADLRAAYDQQCALHGVRAGTESMDPLPLPVFDDLATRVRQMNALRAEAESTKARVATFPPNCWYTVKNAGELYGPFTTMEEAIAVPTTVYPNVGSVTAFRRGG